MKRIRSFCGILGVKGSSIYRMEAIGFFAFPQITSHRVGRKLGAAVAAPGLFPILDGTKVDSHQSSILHRGIHQPIEPELDSH